MRKNISLITITLFLALALFTSCDPNKPTGPVDPYAGYTEKNYALAGVRTGIYTTTYTDSSGKHEVIMLAQTEELDNHTWVTVDDLDWDAYFADIANTAVTAFIWIEKHPDSTYSFFKGELQTSTEVNNKTLFAYADTETKTKWNVYYTPVYFTGMGGDKTKYNFSTTIYSGFCDFCWENNTDIAAVAKKYIQAGGTQKYGSTVSFRITERTPGAGSYMQYITSTDIVLNYEEKDSSKTWNDIIETIFDSTWRTNNPDELAKVQSFTDLNTY